MSSTAATAALREEILEKNRAEYDFANDVLWRLTHYEPTHDGWWFSSIGGKQVLDTLAQRARLGPEKTVLELCCGLGDACRYLAESHGCRATGIDINAMQIAHALANCKERSPRAASRLSFEVGDVVEWQPTECFDAIFGLDALMLVADRRRALENARRALAPGGTILLAEVLAGEWFHEALQRFIWNEDGIIELPTPDGQVQMLADIGFRDFHQRDLTHKGAECFANMRAASWRHREQLIAAKGGPRFRRWWRSSKIYGRCFRERALVYTEITARVP